MCQQFAIWVPDIAPATFSLRSLLRKATAFVCEAEFQQMKAILSDERYMKPFDPSSTQNLLWILPRWRGQGTF